MVRERKLLLIRHHLFLLSCRQQDLTKRPGFTAIVDDLLELEKDIPNSKYTEVRDT
jgi:hypothetical protein